ncbi:MAG TPA: deoxyribose-phosphate aldolase [Lentimicrobium sp.]|nr:deoxyribose-phosphate aldolase [Lentimicrobium sp.]
MKNENLTSDSIKAAIAENLTLPSKTFLSNRSMMRFALSILDLTTLEGNDNEETINALCEKAKGFSAMNMPNVAAVCVYPVFIKQAKELLQGTSVNVASVAGAFPSGQSPLRIKVSEVQYAIEQGADEIDMVISRGKFLSGKYEEVAEEIRTIKETCRNAHLKVILETGELILPNLIYKASMLAMEAGADFIKTSTGKIPVSATTEAAYVMLTAIRDYYNKTGKQTGFKAAGGIATPVQAAEYIQLVEGINGQEWLTPRLFRIGASRLANNLMSTLNDSSEEE